MSYPVLASDADFTVVEYKYCQHCGNGFYRVQMSGRVYCDPCWASGLSLSRASLPQKSQVEVTEDRHEKQRRYYRDHIRPKVAIQ